MSSATTQNVPGTTVSGRILAALIGGYTFCWGLVSLCEAGLTCLGMAFHDAEHLAGMLAILGYLAVFLWAFAARSLRWVWLVLVGGGVAMAALASLLQARLVA